MLVYPATIKFKDADQKRHFAAQKVYPTHIYKDELLMRLCRYHMFYKERVMDVKDGLPKWEGMKGDGEPMKE